MKPPCKARLSGKESQQFAQPLNKTLNGSGDEPQGPAPSPPVRSRTTTLPFLGLQWRDFERLCRRLTECDGTVEATHAYGTSGQAQFGIDILVRLRDGTYEVWQTKRHKTFAAAAVREAVRIFLKHKWAAQAKKFVLAVACELDSAEVVEAIETGRTQLATKSITFDPLGATLLTERLRIQPVVVDHSFDRP